MTFEHGNRRPQLMRHVLGELALLVDEPLDAIQHVVKFVHQVGQFIITVQRRNARTALRLFIDLVNGLGNRANRLRNRDAKKKPSAMETSKAAAASAPTSSQMRCMVA